MFVKNFDWMNLAMGGTRVEILYTLLVFICVLYIVRWIQEVRSLPPGPWGIPILGCFLELKNRQVQSQFKALTKLYGSIISTRLGNQLIVVLSDYRTIRDTFKREEFSGRPKIEFINILGGYGIINTEGAMWKEQRKFLHDKLRGFGMTYMGSSRKIMESKIVSEVNHFIQGLIRLNGAPTSVGVPLAMSISNVICSIIMGVRFTQGDTNFVKFMNLIEEGFKLFGRIEAVNFMPYLKYLPFLQNVRNKISKNRAEMAQFFQKTVDKHRATFDKNNIRDLVDTYLLEIEKAKAEGREGLLFQGKNHDRQMQQILGDLFSAGMETVKTALEWSIVQMLHHPHAAKAVQDELDLVVGRNRMPKLEDMPFLPITEATILEVLRRSSVVPLGTTHATTRTVTVNGYKIPAGSQVVPLLQAVHMDPELWDKPEEFRPSRFLSAEGKVVKPEYFMPFGVGRRMCLGDVLARMELFLFFSSIMHTFNVKLAEGTKLPSLEGNPGVTTTPDPFTVSFLKRHLDLRDNNDSGPVRNVGSH